MKRILSVLLLVTMIFSLSACGNKSQSASSQIATLPSQIATFSVGFSRIDITPKYPINLQMEGYTNQYSQGILMPIMATCVAITDANGNTLLLYTVDKCETQKKTIEELRERLTASTGIPGDNISLCGTHTHSSPVTDSMPDYVDQLVQIAEEALADRSAATITAGSYDVPNMNFTRHYVLKDGTIAGDNFGNAAVGYQDYTSEADHTMRLIRFDREGDKKDVVMVNWQVHPKLASTAETIEGNQFRNLISPDFIGYTRDYVETVQSDVLLAYYTGAAGNVNPFSKLDSEKAIVSKNPEEYGKQFGDHVIAALKDLKPVESGNIESSKQPIIEHGLGLHAYSIGSSIGFATVPAEIFHETGTQIRDGSPFEITFVMSCTNGRDTYIPIEEVWYYNTNNATAPYEASICIYPKGTAESLAITLGEMLTALSTTP